MIVGSFAYYILVAVLMGAGALAGVYMHFKRGRVGTGETAEGHRLGTSALDRLVQRTPLRADVDASGCWDIMSRRNMAAMAFAGAAGPLVAGLAALSLVPH